MLGFQSTHPRGVRHRAGPVPARPDGVSIHAPAWGATPVVDAYRGHDAGVSIHAPAWGATSRRACSSPSRWRFNPRTRVGCDHGTAPALCPDPGFNPRTRVGCDAARSRCPRCRGCFNPRTRVGCDLIRFMRRMGFIVFQSTHPRGVRRLFTQFGDHGAGVSIHAPAWGATPPCVMALHGHSSFNPRTRVGCDMGAYLPSLFDNGFNPRTRVGCDMGAYLPSLFDNGFNPRTRVGCDRLGVRTILPLLRFQSTHPRGVRRYMAATLDKEGRVSIHAPAWGATRYFPSSIREK